MRLYPCFTADLYETMRYLPDWDIYIVAGCGWPIAIVASETRARDNTLTWLLWLLAAI